MTLLLLSSWTALSQNVIPEPSLSIKRHRVIGIVKDFERYDSLKVQFAICQANNLESEKRIAKKDSAIQEYKDSENRLQTVIGNYSAMQKADQKRYSDLEKKYKKEVRAGRFKLVLMGGAIAFALYKTIK